MTARTKILPTDKFWVVSKDIWGAAGIEDIVWETNLHGVALQFLGGLKPDDLLGVFFNRDEAYQLGATELAKKTATASADLSADSGEKFFIVTKAGEKSSFSDVFTEGADFGSLRNMILGGAEVIGIYSDKNRAVDAARETLRAEVGKEFLANRNKV